MANRDANKALWAQWMDAAGVDAIEVRVANPDQAPAMKVAIQRAAGPAALVTDWTQRDASYWGALKVERNVMRLILMLLVVIAALNIISSLVMLNSGIVYSAYRPTRLQKLLILPVVGKLIASRVSANRFRSALDAVRGAKLARHREGFWRSRAGSGVAVSPRGGRVAAG